MNHNIKLVFARIRTLIVILILPFITTGILSSESSLEKTKDWNPGLAEFRSFYGWNDTLGEWQVQYLHSITEPPIALHTFTPKNEAPYAGTLFLLHGYLEHTALRVPLAEDGVSRNWLVAGFDLPGHGLSGGVPFAIDNFDEYREAFDRVLSSREWPKPWRVIAHSTGCAVTLMYIQQNQNPFELVIMESPLLRSYQWEMTMATLRLAGSFIKTLPRRIGGISKDQPFYKLLIRDPLYPDRMPISWCYALRDFVKTIDKWDSMEGNFLILQGDNDTVVDAAYNIPFLRQHLRSPEIVNIPGGTHILLRNEGRPGVQARNMVTQSWIVE